MAYDNDYVGTEEVLSEVHLLTESISVRGRAALTPRFLYIFHSTRQLDRSRSFVSNNRVV